MLFVLSPRAFGFSCRTNQDTSGPVRNGCLLFGRRLFGTVWAVLLILWSSQTGRAQAQDRGLRILGVSVSETYFSEAVPNGIVPPGDVFLWSAFSGGTSVAVSWTKTCAKRFMNLRVVPKFGTHV